MTLAECPSRDQLSSYVLGHETEQTAECVAEHVEQCSKCEATVQDLERQPDQVIVQLRQEAPDEPFVSEEACRRVMSLVKALGHDPNFLGAGSNSVAAGPEQKIRVYRLLDELGHGGMGAAYKALHTELDKKSLRSRSSPASE